MTNLHLILGDQLSQSISSLDTCQKDKDIILMCEVWKEATYVAHHKKKIVLILSAMRHFSDLLKSQGYQLRYTKMEDPNNTGSLLGEVKRVLEDLAIDKIITTHPGEYRVLKDIQSWEKVLGVPVEIREDKRFLCSPKAFKKWAKGRKQLRMEYFYREMRQKYGILMKGNQPIGGRWNYDAQNRNPPKAKLSIPQTYHTQPDAITQDVIQVVKRLFSDHFGDLEPFHFGVTRKQSLSALQQFIEQRLPYFGDYQDAMMVGEPWMYHAHISFYLNCGLLLPMECVQAVEKAYREGKVPLNAAEGFIRQIMGWREYVRGLYWLKMPEYATLNFLDARRKLPNFYWTGHTNLYCLNQCITETKRNAYAHHIQRLMILGNFALITGINPRYVNEWFLIVYADAYEWVELPNVSGMVLFADGGCLASKPYAASGNYINKMSDYCKHCCYQVTKKQGPKACPFNYLYWDFLIRNRNALSLNHRVGMMYKHYDRMTSDQKKAIHSDSQQFLKRMDCDKLV